MYTDLCCLGLSSRGVVSRTPTLPGSHLRLRVLHAAHHRVPFHRKPEQQYSISPAHPQFTTRAATAPFRQILMNGTCKYFQKTAELRLPWNQTQKSAYSRVDLHTHTMWRIWKVFWNRCLERAVHGRGVQRSWRLFPIFVLHIYFALFFFLSSLFLHIFERLHRELQLHATSRSQLFFLYIRFTQFKM